MRCWGLAVSVCQRLVGKRLLQPPGVSNAWPLSAGRPLRSQIHGTTADFVWCSLTNACLALSPETFPHCSMTARVAPQTLHDMIA